MASIRFIPISMVILLLILNNCSAAPPQRESDRKVHIVYMGDVPAEEVFKKTAARTHHDLLESVLGSRDAAEKSLIHSYGKSFNGFAAILSPSEVEVLSHMGGVVSVFESRINHLHTTRSWNFIGLPQSAKRNLRFESDVIIGMLDTDAFGAMPYEIGIWPESDSFDDTGFGPPPSKWKGKCQTSSNFTSCNNKIIGARFYNKGDMADPTVDFISPRDSDGHGSHTSSTVAGNVVRNASLLGLAEGDARGGVPGARIAVYKVCWKFGCSDTDILAAFDDAIHDGVDIISLSLGSDFPSDYFEDSIAIGAFHATKNGILTSNSGGNGGPSSGSVANYSPWSFTVAANTIDRQFHAGLVLGDNKAFEGQAINTFSLKKPFYPLIYGGDAANASGGFTPQDYSFCTPGSLDRNKVKGKIVVCETASSGPDEGVLEAGGVGVVIIDDDNDDFAFSWVISATLIPSVTGKVVKAYINSTRSPVATILRTHTSIGNNPPAPAVVSFSSRGPNPITAGILKPDITAPGADILAAWSKASSVTENPEDKRFVNYNIISGTSMSCPHVSGAAAYVKSFHPNWSPAAIKSALMTTASPLNPSYTGNELAEFAYGSGQIDPVKALDPGLVYDADINSYIDFLCNEGYNTTTLRLVTGDNSTCSNVTKGGVGALNYPSITVAVKTGNIASEIFYRTVTNVGSPQSTYIAVVKAPSGIQITVVPSKLSFTSANQKLSFTVQVKGNLIPLEPLLSGSLTWTSGDYSVRSPIVIYSSILPEASTESPVIYPPSPLPASASAPEFISAPTHEPSAPDSSRHRKNGI